MFSLEELLKTLNLEAVGQDKYRATSVVLRPELVFGGQLLAQSVVAGLAGTEGKSVKTLHSVFLRGASPQQPLDITVDRMHSGRTVATSAVTISQDGRPRVQSLVMLTADEPDFISHGDSGPESSPPDEDGGSVRPFGPWRLQVEDGVDVNDADAIGPAELDLWARCCDAPSDPAINQALLAFISESFLIGTAMRPHAGVGQSQAHVSISTGVLSQTMTFHEPASVADWTVLKHSSPYAGRGRSFGRIDAFDSRRRLIASVMQDAMIRPMPEGSTNRTL